MAISCQGYIQQRGRINIVEATKIKTFLMGIGLATVLTCSPVFADLVDNKEPIRLSGVQLDDVTAGRSHHHHRLTTAVLNQTQANIAVALPIQVCAICPGANQEQGVEVGQLNFSLGGIISP
jgi:hypothetical protein